MSSVAQTASGEAFTGPTTGLHPRLAADCHVLGRLPRASVLLHRNAAVGWLILVPDTEAADWPEMDDAEHERIVHQLRELTQFASHWFAADKMNVAAIGNEVPQMHIHVVARHTDDICWPKPVWGNLPADGPVHAPARVDALIEALAGSSLRMTRSAGRHG